MISAGSGYSTRPPTSFPRSLHPPQSNTYGSRLHSSPEPEPWPIPTRQPPIILKPASVPSNPGFQVDNTDPRVTASSICMDSFSPTTPLLPSPHPLPQWGPISLRYPKSPDPVRRRGLQDIQLSSLPMARRIPAQYSHCLDPASDGIRYQSCASRRPCFAKVSFDSG